MAAKLEIDLHLCNFNGQGYDNGVNMTVQVKGTHVLLFALTAGTSLLSVAATISV
jgi:hypothetical protein